ncbi:restriction endonuclease subunit S [Clostridium sp. UBA3887]|uniref:restriction endonuclease subunit S n=1 Tax=Clostridium sp. UBA3887 TaxID=1946356 RepID=UPI0032173771
MSFKESLFGVIPSDWELCEIGDVANLKQGLQISKKLRLESNEKGSIPLLKITDLPSKNFSEFVRDIPSNYIADKGDIIYTRTGQVGLVYTDVRGCVHNNCFKVIFNYDKFDKYYAFYYLNSNQVRSYSNSVACGSVQKDLTHTAFKKCLFSYPPLKEQRAIAKILRSLDEKIETNNQINKNLEEMAQSIFKQWFVDFEFPNEDGEPYKSSGGEMVESELCMIPKGWEVKTIGDLAKVVSKGTTPRKNDIDIATDEKNIKFLKVKDIGNDGIIDLSDIEYIPKSVHLNQLKRSVLECKDILISIAGTIGRVSYVDDELIDSNTNQAVAFIRLSDINKYFLFVLYKFKSVDFQNSIQSKVVQGVQANISLTIIKNEKIIAPYERVLKEYNSILSGVFNKKDLINKENKRLKAIRDTLLPKLMSGEIRVQIENNLD